MFTIQTMTVRGMQVLIEAINLNESITIDRVDGVVSALNSMTIRQASPGSHIDATTDAISMSRYGNTMRVSAKFDALPVAKTLKTFLVYATFMGESFYLAGASTGSTPGVYIPGEDDTLDSVYIEFNITLEDGIDAIAIPSSALSALHSDIEYAETKIRSNMVTTHTYGGNGYTGDNQTIYGTKRFEDEIETKQITFDDEIYIEAEYTLFLNSTGNVEITAMGKSITNHVGLHGRMLSLNITGTSSSAYKIYVMPNGFSPTKEVNLGISSRPWGDLFVNSFAGSADAFEAALSGADGALIKAICNPQDEGVSLPGVINIGNVGLFTFEIPRVTVDYPSGTILPSSMLKHCNITNDGGMNFNSGEAKEVTAGSYCLLNSVYKRNQFAVDNIFLVLAIRVA